MVSYRINSSVAIAALFALNSYDGHFSVAAFSLSHRFTSHHLNSLHSTTFSSTEKLESIATSSRQPTALFSTKKLSRPERKALEREKKQAKENGAPKKLVSKKFELHSNNISELTLKSTADDVIKAIKR